MILVIHILVFSLGFIDQTPRVIRENLCCRTLIIWNEGGRVEIPDCCYLPVFVSIVFLFSVLRGQNFYFQTDCVFIAIVRTELIFHFAMTNEILEM